MMKPIELGWIRFSTTSMDYLCVTLSDYGVWVQIFPLRVRLTSREPARAYGTFGISLGTYPCWHWGDSSYPLGSWLRRKWCRWRRGDSIAGDVR